MQEIVRWTLGAEGVKSEIVRTLPWPLNGNTVIGQFERFRVPDCNEFFYFSIDPLMSGSEAARAPFSSGGSGAAAAGAVSAQGSSGGGKGYVGMVDGVGRLAPFPHVEDEASRRRGFLGRACQILPATS